MTEERGAINEYVVDLEGVDPLLAQAACRLFVDRIASSAALVWVDAYTDAADLPAPAEVARRALLARSPTGMGIELDVDDERDLRLLRDFAFWSIHVEAHAGTTIIGSIHDTGDSLWFLGDESDAEAFRAVGVDVKQTPPTTARRVPWRLWRRRR